MLNKMFVFLCLLLPLGANAAYIIDQSNEQLSYGGFCFINSFNSCGQSFVPSNGNLDGASIFIATNSIGVGDVNMSVYDNYIGSPSGFIAGATANNVTASDGWIDVFWSSVNVSVGQTYYLVLSSPQDTNLLTGASHLNQYSDGSIIHQGNQNWPLSDLNFKTYASPVPLPAAAWLFISAIAGLAGAKRLSRSKGSA
jgi:hypothetical protein